jgi:hypothetical protein
MDIVRLLSEREAFTELLDKRVDQLLYDLEHGHDFLGFYAQSTAASDRDTLTSDIRAEVVDSNQAILTCRRYWVPHTLEFNTVELRNWAAALQQKSEISWREILDFLRSNFSREADYERLLAMAYLLASLKKWDFAERFCRRAIGPSMVYEPSTVGSLRYEAHFFLAVCMRMHKPRPERHRDALQQLDHASHQWRFQRYGVDVTDVTLDDPRYLIERGNHIYRWNKPAEEAGSRKAAKKGSPPPLRPTLPIESALDAWTRALALIEPAGDNRLRAQVHNNLCFYYADAATPDLAKIREHLGHMVAAQSIIEKTSRRWPPVFIHTVAVARHILYEQSGSAEDRAALESAAADLEWAMQNAELLEVHKESFTKYLESVRQTLARAR